MNGEIWACSSIGQEKSSITWTERRVQQGVQGTLSRSWNSLVYNCYTNLDVICRFGGLLRDRFLSWGWSVISWELSLLAHLVREQLTVTEIQHGSTGRLSKIHCSRPRQQSAASSQLPWTVVGKDWWKILFAINHNHTRGHRSTRPQDTSTSCVCDWSSSDQEESSISSRPDQGLCFVWRNSRVGWND